MSEDKKPKLRIPKIHSVRFGLVWLGVGVLVGAVIPLVLWFSLHRIVWALILIGGLIIASFGVVFAIEMHQDFAEVPYYERHLKDDIPFDPREQYAVIRCSICNGEQVAGFKNKKDGHFTEVMVIHSPEEEKRFLRMYDLESVKKEY